ncbi:FAD-dependent oxidoreductase [Paenibacillus sp. ACRRX]|uniref:FAD-dependent oxidoreductase n=1 Tax=unclassified Paenibacillus TaxID=185978 RepID=UPI001EF726B5|nr:MULTISPECIES: FAD-dependent oxidoreductase [unclassified Paenibacillus]MCG7406709.1 FAD-dependent oxidoreductase [Paenibacillus sp. ACRRX]MDK8179727.1 FAD-dependent oxidoreductase [Paenibacillus sp. UMB4589-SE434]
MKKTTTQDEPVVQTKNSNEQGRTIVIVGGVAGGASAAARLRRMNETDHIIMIERGEHISFANCGLPYYIGGSITDRNKLLVQTVKGLSDRYAIEVRIWSEAVSIDRERQILSIKNVQDGTAYEQPYDILVLSPGSKPIRPNFPGIDEADNIFTLRNIPDTDLIKSHVDQHGTRKAVVIGGGFIGVEMAENLRERGIQVTLVEKSEQVMNPLDQEMAAIVHQHMRDHGVELLLGQGVQAFEQQGHVVVLDSGLKLDTDMTILAIGVQPENQLAVTAGLDTGVRGAIRVNEQLQTSDPHIYAVGDVIEVKDAVNGQPTYVPLAWGANRQGRLIGDILNGRSVSYKGAYGTAIAKVFQLTAASTGNNEKVLQRSEIAYRVVHTHPLSHAGYYPGAASMSLKLLFSPEDGRILGAQGVGMAGVDKRIDVIATAMRGGLSVYDLSDLELSYAPPYSSAKDPVNMLGYIASNMMDDLVDTVQWNEVDALISQGATVIDVREPIEVQAGHIEGTINIPLHQLRAQAEKLPKNETVYVSCQVGLRGYVAARMLSQQGIQVRNIDGGYKTYATMVKERISRASGGGTSGQAASSGEPDNDQGERRAEHTEKIAPSDPNQLTAHKVVDARGLQCPGPIMQLYQAVQSLEAGQVVHIMATDPGFRLDAQKWSEKTGNTLLHAEMKDGQVHVYIQKGAHAASLMEPPAAGSCNASSKLPAEVASNQRSADSATMVVFSGELDKAIASFIIASGAAAMGKKVTMFFTFWGLSILKRSDAPRTDKDTFGKMFSMMLPGSAKQLPLSKMNFGGIGPKMIETMMARKNVDSLETLMNNAMEAGVKFVACTMSMELMGFTADELLPGVQLGGVATYLSDADDSGLNLFI